MPTQLLFYEAAVPVSAARHGGWSIEPRDYSFSKGINSVPLTAVEFDAAAPEYAIVFAGQPGQLVPAAILGVRAAQNLYLDEKGDWDARYVPAYVRRYPFVFSTRDEGKSFTLCLDETFPGFNQDGRGQPLFGAERKPSAYTERVLRFLQQYQAEFQRTREFCNMLEELQVLEPMQAQVTRPTGERLSLTGFQAVNRDKLRRLPAEKLGVLAQGDAMELIHLHLHSLRNFGQMRDRLADPGQPQPQAEEPVATA